MLVATVAATLRPPNRKKFGLTQGRKVLHANVGRLELACPLSNVSQAGHVMGWARERFYLGNEWYDTGGARRTRIAAIRSSNRGG
ncbi:hypothetical protein MB84_27600 (plasmid) [Pandoraea oxalativorans]|uniref:Uncharacterized protein n=1 Tax=Pandoraea oxalativorans TaxID=573737 RepID=A0A0G3IFB4_9BURK|nr:hypothetical protein MB84_27600 [Pandoraea oxalativorans]